jgi:signal transduction histidine kinase
VNAKDLVEEALTTVRRGFEQGGIDLRVELPSDLPKVRTDAERAARSIMSLLFHARKFRVAGPVTVRAQRRGGSVACEIEYGAAGFDPEEARRSLDLFYPARKRTNQVLSATGLGLGLIRAVMRRIGADLEIASQDKDRVRLTLLLPMDEGKS